MKKMFRIHNSKDILLVKLKQFFDQFFVHRLPDGDYLRAIAFNNMTSDINCKCNFVIEITIEFALCDHFMSKEKELG